MLFRDIPHVKPDTLAYEYLFEGHYTSSAKGSLGTGRVGKCDRMAALAETPLQPTDNFEKIEGVNFRG
jgi:hypothetical protein